MEPGVFTAPELVTYAGYRLNGLVFWSLPLIAVLSCAAHAVRRAFGQPSPSREESEVDPAGPSQGPVAASRKRVVLRHAVPQRLYHWVNASTTIVLLITGLIAYAPDLFPGSVSGASRFTLHRWLGVVLIAGIPFHVVYDAFVQNSLGFMWFGRDAFRTLRHITKNFFGLSSAYPKHHKYHPMQIVTHWMMAGNLLALIVTGLILWKPTRILFPLGLLGLGWDFVFFNRTLHDFFTASLFALIIGHVYFAVMIKHNWIISRTMITGKIDYDEYVKLYEIEGVVEVKESGRAREARV